jgi:hypothetical protein
LFSTVLGMVAARCGAGTRVYRGLMGTCALSAIGVGCFWLFH